MRHAILRQLKRHADVDGGLRMARCLANVMLRVRVTGVVLVLWAALCVAARAGAPQVAAQDPAHARLVTDAEQALAAGPFSVMDKRRVPPSGDRHDFVSLAPYWWPDPAKPNGLPYIRRDGEVNPESKVDADDVRFGRMVEAASTLARAFGETRDERYAARAALLLRVWFLDAATRMNPHLEYGQGIPGRTPGRSAGIIATRRLVDVVDAARTIESSPSWTAGDRDGLHAWCAAYAAWLRTSAIGRDEAAARNNHGTWYDAQLTALLLYTGRRDEARARVEAARRRIATQIEPDGRQPEELARTRSWSYSVMNLEGWFTVARLAERAGVDLWTYRTPDGRSLRAALDYLVPFAAGPQKWPHQQITPVDWDGFTRLLGQAAVVWKRPEYGRLAARLAAGHGAPPAPRSTTSSRPR